MVKYDDIGPEQSNKPINKMEKQWHLPKVLKFYQTKDFALQQRASFIYYLSISVIVSLLFIISSSIFIQISSNQYNGIYLPIILPLIALIVLFILCFFFLKRGNYGLSAHLLIGSALVTGWFIMWADKGEMLTRFDTIVLIVALLNILPLFITRYKSSLLIYISLNIIVLVCFVWIVGREMGLSVTEMLDYIIDTSIAMIFTGILGYNIFNINKRTLDKALFENIERKQTEIQLKQSRDQFESLVSNIPGISYRRKFDENWTMLYISSEIDRISGYASSDFIDNIRTYDSIILPADREMVANKVIEAVKNKQPWEVEYRINHIDGAYRWVFEKGRAILNSSGLVDYLDGFILDITDRKTANFALIESELKYRTLFENAQIGIYQTTPQGEILSANPSLLQMLGFDSFEELKLRNLESDDVYVDSTRELFKELMSKNGMVRNFESKWKTKRGETIIIVENSIAVKDWKNEIIYYEGFFENITERKKTEKALKESQQLFKALTQMSPVGIFRNTTDGYTTFVNPKWCELSGLSFDEAIGNGWLKAVHPEDRELLNKNWKFNITKQEKSKAQYRFLKPDGKIVWVLGETIPEIVDDKIIGYIGTITDITTRIKIEDLIKQSEEIFRSLIELAPNSISVTDLNGRYMIVNNIFIKNTGCNFDDIIGKNDKELELGFDKTTEAKIREEILSAGKVENMEAVFTNKSGNKFDIYYSGKVIQMNGNPVILSSTIDITEKKKTDRELEKYRNGLELLVNAQTEELIQNIEELTATQEAIEKKNEELHQVQLELLEEKKLIDALMENIPDAIYFKNLKSQFLKVSKSIRIKFNVDNNFEIIGKTDFDYFANKHASTAFNIEQAIIRSGKPSLDFREKEIWKDGHISYVSSNKMPLEDINGNIIGTFGISRDITKLVEMESAIKLQNEELLSQREELEVTLNNLQQAQIQLIQSDKMASLGVLAAGVAHEINNPLNFINGGVIGLESYFKEFLNDHFDTIYPLLESIQVGVSRAAAIVTSLNHYSRQDNISRTECDINSIIDHCLVMLQSETKSRIAIQKNYTQTNYKLIGNEGKLHQVFLNILANSCQAIEQNGVIAISTVIETGKLKISIRDNGCGISEENLNKIMDPFFTTKDPGKGTGLGLSITYNIIKEHSGTIEFNSSLESGTAVIISLPINI